MGEGTFAGSDVVGRYWQTRCRGFEVRSPRGRRLGTVERLELDRDTAAAAVLVVRRRRRRRRPLRVRPELVSLVDPWQRSLVVSLPRRRKLPSWPAAAARSVVRAVPASGDRAVRVMTGARRTGPPLRRAAIGVAGRLSDSRRLVPPARRALRVLGRRALLVAALVLWLYSIVAFSLVRAVLSLLQAATAGTVRWSARVRQHLHGARWLPARHL